METKLIKFETKHIQELIPMYQAWYGSKGYNIDEEVLTIRFQSMIDRAPDYTFAAVNEKDELVGAILCYFEKHYIGKDLVIDNLIIDEKYRGKGLGKILMKKVLQTAKEKRLENVMLLADVNQEFPKKWYEELGFKNTGWTEFEIPVSEIK